MRHDDHNQSSRLDLDWEYDPEAGTDLDESAASPLKLNQIDEDASSDASRSSQSSSAAFSNASSMEGTVEGGGPEEDEDQVMQQPQDNNYYDDRPRSRGGGDDDYRSDHRGGGQRRRGRERQSDYPSHNDTNGYGGGGGGMNGIKTNGYELEATPARSRSPKIDVSSYGMRINGELEATVSSRRSPTLEATASRPHNKNNYELEATTFEPSISSRRHNGSASNNRKLVNIKLWDPGDTSSEPTYVTVAMDVATKRELGDAYDMSMGVGQKIQMQQKEELHHFDIQGREAAGGREQKVAIVTWQPPKPVEEASSWRPPFALSEKDMARKEQMQMMLDRSNNRAIRNDQPQSVMQVGDQQITPSRTIDLPSSMSKPEALEPTKNVAKPDIEAKTSTSNEFEAPPAPVKGLEPFTIPSILSSTVIKRTPNEKVGLAFRKANGTVVIEKIVPGSAFDGTALRPGYECLSINGHRLRSARRAAEIVRESGSSLTLVASNAPRPPGTMYTMISLKDHRRSSTSSYNSSGSAEFVAGMYFKIKHGLVQLWKVDQDSPIGSTSMKVGDFVLAINGSVIANIPKAVEVLASESNANDDGMIPVLYFNMRQLRVSLVDKVIGDLWKKEWSDGYDECVVLQPSSGGDEGGSNNNPLTLRFKEEGMCELLDPLRAFRENNGSEEHNNSSSSVVPPDHPLHSVVETLNHGIMCVLSAIQQGVEIAASANAASSRGSPKSGDGGSGDALSHRNGDHRKSSDLISGGGGGTGGSLMSELAKLSGMYKEGLLSKEDFETIKSKLLTQSHGNAM